ncbi:MAG: N-acetyl-alpha-D-glucosaminyl L-malate synthase BshA [Candidatus Margulisiibacteriota bacterium]
MRKSKKLKVGIACFPSPGGSGVVATELGLALAQRGHDVHLFSYDIPIRLAENTKPKSFKFHKVEASSYPVFAYPPYTISLASRLANFIDDEGLDIINVHYAIPHAVSAFLAKKITKDKVKHIVSLHGTDITLVGQSQPLFATLKYCLHQSDGITTSSKFLSKEAAKYFGVRHSVVIPNFVPPPMMQTLKPLAILPKHQTIVHISNFRSVKRIVDVIKIYALIKKEVPSTQLVMLGDGPDQRFARELAVEMGLGNSVSFLGFQNDIAKELAKGSLFLLPSAKESFPVVLLEAMALGVPPVTTKVGGIPELVTHGKNGFLAPVGSIKKMAKYGVKLLKDKNLRQKMAEHGQNLVKSKFTVEQIVPQYEKYFNQVLTN